LTSSSLCGLTIHSSFFIVLPLLVDLETVRPLMPLLHYSLPTTAWNKAEDIRSLRLYPPKSRWPYGVGAKPLFNVFQAARLQDLAASAVTNIKDVKRMGLFGRQLGKDDIELETS